MKTRDQIDTWRCAHILSQAAAAIAIDCEPGWPSQLIVRAQRETHAAICALDNVRDDELVRAALASGDAGYLNSCGKFSSADLARLQRAVDWLTCGCAVPSMLALRSRWFAPVDGVE